MNTRLKYESHMNREETAFVSRLSSPPNFLEVHTVYLIITKMFSFIMFNTYKLRISQTVVRSGLGSSGGSLIKELMN